MTASAIQPDRLGRLLAYLEHDEGNLRLRKDAIREALDAQAWDTAGQLIEAGLWLHPDEAELLAFSGLIHLHAQHYAEAQQALSEALQKGVADARYYLAFVIFMQRQYSQALEWLADPLPHPTPLALILRARCLHHLARADEAIADCRASLQLNPEDADANGVLA